MWNAIAWSSCAQSCFLVVPESVLPLARAGVDQLLYPLYLLLSYP
jgi:hypothetical protein